MFALNIDPNSVLTPQHILFGLLQESFPELRDDCGQASLQDVVCQASMVF